MLPAGYKYDVFLSYSRAQQWPNWVNAHFLPIIEHWLSAELGRDVAIFHDVQTIGIGQLWPEELQRGLAASRIMITLWSKNYFRSQWCVRELGAILAKADHLRSRGLSGQIVFPVAIHDSSVDDLPELVQAMTFKRIQDYADPFIHHDSALRENLSQTLQNLCKQVAQEINALPDETFAWPMHDYSSYVERLQMSSAGQTSRPTLGHSQ